MAWLPDTSGSICTATVSSENARLPVGLCGSVYTTMVLSHWKLPFGNSTPREMGENDTVENVSLLTAENTGCTHHGCNDRSFCTGSVASILSWPPVHIPWEVVLFWHLYNFSQWCVFGPTWMVPKSYNIYFAHLLPDSPLILKQSRTRQGDQIRM